MVRRAVSTELRGAWPQAENRAGLYLRAQNRRYPGQRLHADCAVGCGPPDTAGSSCYAVSKPPSAVVLDRHDAPAKQPQIGTMFSVVLGVKRRAPWRLDGYSVGGAAMLAIEPPY